MAATLQQTYRDLVASGSLSADAGQRLAIEKLSILAVRLRGYEAARPTKVKLAFFGWGREKTEIRNVPGLYIYGGVGRGKSMLMDMFFDHVELEQKRRVHFHAFMQEMHDLISRARTEGVDDPIPRVADKVADEAALLCFDEMQITDITDAMLVGRLFEALFDRGVVMVATSNRHPDDLYKDGLNRQLFLPFIALFKEKMEVFELESPTDHRQARLAGRDVYHAPLGDAAHQALLSSWNDLTESASGEPQILIQKGREITIPRSHNGVAWASFADLCEASLGPGDYLLIAGTYRVLILEGIPILGATDANAAKRFVTLIDTLYEAGTVLIVSAAAEPDGLYTDGAGAFEFERTASRLAEMRSADWVG